jgi:hypothetical protein
VNNANKLLTTLKIVIKKRTRVRERNEQEVVEIRNGGNDVISAQRLVLSLIWFAWIKNRKKKC